MTAIVRFATAQGVPGAVGEAGIGAATILANASIPTSGSVTLSVTPNFFLNDGGSIVGNLKGVDGTLARSGSAYIFTPSTYPGSPVTLTAGVDSFYPVRGTNLTFIVPTIAALKTRTVTLSEKVSVVDYSTANDGGGGMFYADLSDTTTADNGGTVIVGNTGIRWKRLNDQGYISVKCFGAKGDGTTDDTTAITNAIIACDALGKRLVFPFGDFVTITEITVKAVGLIIEGQTRANAGDGSATVTRITWKGTDPTKAMFKCANANHCLFQNILFHNTTPLLAYFLVLNDTAFLGTNGSWISSNNIWKECTFGSPRTSNKAQYNLFFSGAASRGSQDSNNDLHKIIDCVCMGYSEAAIATENASQLHDLQICRTSMTGVVTGGKYAVYMDGGFFNVISGSGGYHTVADFSIGNPSPPCAVRSWNSEESARLLDQRTFSGASQCFILEACRFEAPAGIASDGYVIKVSCPMPLSVRNCLFVGNANSIPKIFLNSSVNIDSASVEVVACEFDYNQGYTNQLIPTQHIVIGQGNWAINYFGNQTTYPNIQRHDNYFTKVTRVEAKDTLITGAHTITEVGKTFNTDSRHTYAHGFELTDFGTVVAGSPAIPGVTTRSRLISFTEFPPCTDTWGNGFNIQGCVMVQASGAGTTANSSSVFIKLARLGIAFASYSKVTLGLTVAGSISILGFLNDGYIIGETSHQSFSFGVPNQYVSPLSSYFNTASGRPAVTSQEFKLELALIEDSTYTHLCLKIIGRTTSAAFRACNINFNLSYAGVQL